MISVIFTRLVCSEEVVELTKDPPTVAVPALLDALVDAIAGKEETQARLDVQVAIFNHTMTAIVDAGRAADKQSYITKQVMKALVGSMGETLAQDL